MTATNHTAPHPEPTPRRALVLFAHGARNPEWAEPLRYAQSVLSERLPDHTVTVAFLEFLSPTLTEAVMELAPTHSEIVIVPWFVAEGGIYSATYPSWSTIWLHATRRSNSLVFRQLAPSNR
ncbi:sirohydrochlorin chelatase [Hydrogenophilus thermoluteolus]|uniref:sirohydrochlorin chelatase n=1 Tax=Hydrogenophilus thermoluteolus TaxID=297 RepID=UPI003F671F06